MKKLLRLLLHPWLLLAVALLAVALAIWIIGPLVAIDRWRPLESENARWLLIGATVLLVVLRQAWRQWKARRTNAAVVTQLTAAPPSAVDNDVGQAEVEVLQQRFTQALEQLRQARFASNRKGVGGAWSDLSSRVGKRYLYELPWYVIIGAPGSGKTTALLNSGLHFPLAATLGEQSVRGVGGTRNCDWWFTDEAVLIDTAGRYTTQNSVADTDGKAWQGFLGLLKRSRPRQPVSGVMVTVSVPDLLMQSATERSVHAQALRRRMQELHQHLGIRFPIYLLVTKCDLLSGFTDYLGDIDKETRAAPWGFTFKLDAEQQSDLSSFKNEFEALEARLQNGLIDRLQPERDPQRRARIYAFPQQFAGLRDVLHDFAQVVFSPSQFEQHPLLRGVYFVSGTQEGTPIDRMLGRLSRSFGLAAESATAAPGQGKSFFLTRLLRELVFTENGLSGTNLKWERQRGALALGGYAALVGVVGVTLFAWGTSYINNRRYVAQIEESLGAAEKLIQGGSEPSSDPRPLLPRLHAAQTLPRAMSDDNVPWSYGFGLYQGHKLESAAQRAYERLLVDGLLPSVALRVEQQLRSGGVNSELQYEALKAYVMLQDPSRFDAKALKNYVGADWGATLPKDTTTEQREALMRHLDALLALGPTVSPLPLDKALLAQTQTRLAAVPLPNRVYQRLKRQGVAADIPEFSIAKVAGNNALLVLRRASGSPLTKGVPGLYTYDGYHKGLQKEVSDTAKQLADEEVWVLGVLAGKGSLGGASAGLPVADQVRRLYLNEYVQVWEELIADIKIIQPKSLAEAVQAARTLSAPDNPIVPLLRAISRETTLATSPDLVAKAEKTVRDKLADSRNKLDELFGAPKDKSAAGPTTQQVIEAIVDTRFAGLRQYVTSPGGQGPAPVDNTLGLLNEIYTYLNSAETAVKAGSQAPSAVDMQNKAKTEGPRTPEPARTLVQTLSTSGAALALGATRGNLAKGINDQIGEFCRQAVTGRYPFMRGSERDVTTEDFARLFAPGGLFDDYFQKNLLPHVDTSTRPWTFREQAGASMGTPGTLLQFQRAAAIRDVFFRSGGAVPGLKLEFKPSEMDTSIKQFLLDVDGQVVRYAHGPLIPAALQWPGPRGSTQVRVEFSPPLATGQSGLVTSGPWALFRMIDKLQLEPSAAPERFRATFTIEGRKAAFDVTTSSVRSPFRLRELEEFACPKGL